MDDAGGRGSVSARQAVRDYPFAFAERPTLGGSVTVAQRPLEPLEKVRILPAQPHEPMQDDKLACLILAAGDSTRMKSGTPKVLHSVCGRPLVAHILANTDPLALCRRVVVVGYGHEQVREALGDGDQVEFVLQPERRGTGDAVRVAEEAFSGFEGDILVACGDTPLLRSETLEKLVERHRHQDASATILTANLRTPEGYGRVLRNPDHTVLAIREHRDANIYERKIRECNTGTYVFKSTDLFAALKEITPDNEQNEYYLTDVIHVLVKWDRRVEAFVATDASETMGVNNRIQLAEAERILRQRIRERHMLAGVTLVDPPSIFIDHEVTIGRDSIIEPHSYLWGNTTVGCECHIGPQAQLIDCHVGDGATVRASVIRGGEVAAGETVGPYAVRGVEQ